MGYRSHVIYAIAGPHDQMWVFLTTLKLQVPSAGLALQELHLTKWGRDHLVLAGNFEDTKWYPEYKDVQAHKAVWDFARGHYDDFQLYGSFCRVGEESDDIENYVFSFKDESDCFELCHLYTAVETTIDFDAPNLLKK